MNEQRSQEAEAPYRDLREWLRHLAATDRLAVTRPGIGLRHQLAAVAKRLEREKAVLFPSPGNHAIPVVANLLTGRAQVAEAMNVAEDDMLAYFQEAVRNPVAPVEVTDAPVQEVVHREVDVERQLPVPIHNELDSGPYITAGVLITRNPRTGVQNVSIHRSRLCGPDRITAFLLQRHTRALMDMAEAAGEPLEVAVVIGVDPCTLLASQALLALDRDELELAGALRGAPTEVVKCVTSDLLIPANAEIVIEGRLLPGVRESDGPFGEFPQYYGSSDDAHMIQIDAITHRAEPLYHTIVGGGLEHLIIGAIPREASLLEQLRGNYPNILDLHLSFGGTCRYNLVIKIEAKYGGQAKNIIMAAFGAHFDIKQVTVVDEDVDIHDADEVQWAVSTRFQADRDLVVIPGAQGSKLDHTGADGITAKMGLDATVPEGADRDVFKRIRVPGAEDLDFGEVADTQPARTLARILS